MSEPETQPLILPDWLLAYVGRLSLELEFLRTELLRRPDKAVGEDEKEGEKER